MMSITYVVPVSARIIYILDYAISDDPVKDKEDEKEVLPRGSVETTLTIDMDRHCTHVVYIEHVNYHYSDRL